MRLNDPPQPLATLMVATCNVLNLAQPGRAFYAGQDPYSEAEHGRKLLQFLEGEWRQRVAGHRLQLDRGQGTGDGTDGHPTNDLES